MNSTFNNKKQFGKTARHIMKSNSVSNVTPPLRAIFFRSRKGNYLNEYVASISDLDDLMYDCYFLKTLRNFVKTKKVYDTINSLHTNKALGPDRISHSFLKNIALGIS